MLAYTYGIRLDKFFITTLNDGFYGIVHKLIIEERYREVTWGK